MAKGVKKLFGSGFVGLLKELVVPIAKENFGDDKAAKLQINKLAKKSPAKSSAKVQSIGGWRPAKTLIKLRDQVNAIAPHRSKASDGIVGDLNHQNSNSDHNPWVIDGNVGVVTAIDITHDPARDCDAGVLANAIVGSMDARVKYVIWNKQIANHLAVGGKPAWAWRAYNGANPHNKHVHISVLPDKAKYDDIAAWSLGTFAGTISAASSKDLHAPMLIASDSIAWGKRVPGAFKKKAIAVANNLLMDPNVLMAVMAFETGREFKSSTVNPTSKATGLIQFIPATAVALGTTTAKLAAMSEVNQLDFVEQYLRPHKGKMTDVASAYMAVLWPVAVSKPLSFILFTSPSKQYVQNKGLDSDDDGKVTKAEASAKVSQQLVEGMRPENFG